MNLRFIRGFGRGSLKKLFLLLILQLSILVLYAQEQAPALPEGAQGGTAVTQAAAVGEEALLLDEQPAGNTDNAGNVLPPVEGVSLGDYFRMFFSLLLVLAVIYGVFWMLKRYGSTVPVQQSRFLSIHATQTLGKGKALHLVQVGKQVFLVGASDSHVSLVSEISDKETIDSLSLESAEALESTTENFADILKQALGARKTQPGIAAVGQAMSQSVNTLKNLTDRVSGIGAGLRGRRNEG